MGKNILVPMGSPRKSKLNTYTVSACPRPLKIKECALMVCGTDDDEISFAVIAQNYRSMAK